MNTEETIIHLVARQSDRSVADIHRENTLMEDIGLDSLDIVELAMEVEDEFAIDIYDDDDAEKVKTVDDLIKYVESHVKEARAT